MVHWLNWISEEYLDGACKNVCDVKMFVEYECGVECYFHCGCLRVVD